MDLKDIDSSKKLKVLVERTVREVITKLIEDTTLVSLVAKSPDEATANKAVSILNSKNVGARTTHPSKFGLSVTEKSGWGIYVEPADVKKAAEILNSSIRGLEYDPYVSIT